MEHALVRVQASGRSFESYRRANAPPGRLALVDPGQVRILLTVVVVAGIVVTRQQAAIVGNHRTAALQPVLQLRVHVGYVRLVGRYLLIGHGIFRGLARLQKAQQTDLGYVAQFVAFRR